MSFFRNQDPKLQALKQVELFAGCSRARLVALAAQMDEIVAGAGSVLVREGRPGHSFYVVIEGEAVATSNGQPIATFGPGGFFGEISMIDRDPAVATVTATTDCTLMVLGHDQFRRALQAGPDLEVTVTRVMRERLHANAMAGLPGR
ncbi:MAG TPA: cyclic nucleotide-binding domain-containing protein [Candidatus Dormibacteraeota bacterium]|jgi:CRP-like cAMP-binding protein